MNTTSFVFVALSISVTACQLEDESADQLEPGGETIGSCVVVNKTSCGPAGCQELESSNCPPIVQKANVSGATTNLTFTNGHTDNKRVTWAYKDEQSGIRSAWNGMLDMYATRDTGKYRFRDRTGIRFEKYTTALHFGWVYSDAQRADGTLEGWVPERAYKDAYIDNNSTVDVLIHTGSLETPDEWCSAAEVPDQQAIPGNVLVGCTLKYRTVIKYSDGHLETLPHYRGAKTTVDLSAVKKVAKDAMLNPKGDAEEFVKMHVLCHEVGHALGLSHTTSSLSCMRSDLTFGTISVYNAAEIDLLNTLPGNGGFDAPEVCHDEC